MPILTQGLRAGGRRAAECRPAVRLVCVKRADIVHLSTVHHSRDNRIYNKEVPALLAAGHDVALLIQADADESSPVPLVALPRPKNRLSRLILTQAQAWHRLGHLRPRLLHVHDPELIPLAWAWARTHGARCVFDAHEDLIDQVASKEYLKAWQRPLAAGYARLLTRWADRGMDAIVAATTPVAERYSNPNRVVVHNYPWGRDCAVEPATVPGRLLYVGDLSEERKLSFMVEVTRRVQARVPSARLVLAGRVLPEGREAASRFDPDVVTHLGLLPPAEVPALLATAQVGLIFLEPLDNYTNSLPTKLFEYLAAGVPFAASDFPYWRETFGPLDAGVFVDSQDVDATADALVALLSDPARCAELGRHGRAAIRESISFEAEADKLTELATRLLNGTPADPGRAAKH